MARTTLGMLIVVVAAAAGAWHLGPLTGAAAAEEAKAGAISVADAWARPVIGNRPTAAYATISNRGETEDRLIGARSPAFGSVELHETTQDGDVMRMAPVDAIPAPAGETTRLEPGGLHIMLFEPAEPVAEGGRFPLLLEFEAAGTIAVEVAVTMRGPAMDHGSHGSMDHGSHGSTNHGSEAGSMHGDMEQPPE